MKNFAKAGAAISLTVGLIAGSTAAADAASYNGTRIYSGLTQPLLTVDAKGSGTLTWVNRLTAASTTQYFPGGHSENWSPYKEVNWTVANSAGFYYVPTSTCY